MKIIGLTGSIAMGKSTAAYMLRRMGFPVFDADKIVRLLTARDGRAIRPIARIFPLALDKGELIRPRLAKMVFHDPAARKMLERILHPLVAEERENFLKFHRKRRSEILFLDIPLLFENKLEKLCDAVIVVSAPPFLQYERALKREGMNAPLFRQILSQQMSDAEKRKRADRILQSGLGKAHTWRQLKKIVHDLQDA